LSLKRGRKGRGEEEGIKYSLLLSSQRLGIMVFCFFVVSGERREERVMLFTL